MNKLNELSNLLLEVAFIINMKYFFLEIVKIPFNLSILIFNQNTSEILIFKMFSGFNFSRLSFSIGSKHIDGKKTVIGGALVASGIILYSLRQWFKGGWCYLERDLTGKNAVITGGNGGIGKQAAKRLVQLGANVIIGSRDDKNNLLAVQEIRKVGKGTIIAFRLDLADPKSIEKFAEEVDNFLSGQPLHYLLNNAGLFALPDRRFTIKNIEMQIGVNHFGHFYLTYLLWHNLKSAGNPRIVNVSSAAHRSSMANYDLDFNNLRYDKDQYDSFAAYSRSKKCNILFTKQLQKRMNAQKINGTVLCLHPGVIRTGIQKQFLSSWWKKLISGIFYPLILLTFKNQIQGAQTSLYCLLEEQEKLIKGGYYSDCKLSKTLSNQVQNQQISERLWKQSENIFGISFKL